MLPAKRFEIGKVQFRAAIFDRFQVMDNGSGHGVTCPPTRNAKPVIPYLRRARAAAARRVTHRTSEARSASYGHPRNTKPRIVARRSARPAS